MARERILILSICSKNDAACDKTARIKNDAEPKTNWVQRHAVKM